ncbi:MAG TPA: BrnT family toxin [Burkholderiales bacterium]|nr:BrnT family toxin [Burkholderiales bacterium]
MSDVSFDPVKNERNIASRGISFEVAEQFEWNTAMVAEDLRKEYGERRFQALGFIAGRLHAMVFTPRDGKVHVISLRKANRREMRRYEAQA